MTAAPPGPPHPAPPTPAGNLPPGYAPPAQAAPGHAHPPPGHAQGGYPPQGGHPPPGYGGPLRGPQRKRPGIPGWAIVLIILAALVPIIGIFAAISIPAFAKYMRRAKAAEAKAQIARMFDGAAGYFSAHDACVGGEGPVVLGPMPPLSVNCNEGPGGRCVPSSSGGGAGSYAYAGWEEDSTWAELGFAQEQGHYFHYAYRANNFEGGCQFTVQAFADLDDDGMYSTFERSGAADMSGINAAAGLFIDNEVE